MPSLATLNTHDEQDRIHNLPEKIGVYRSIRKHVIPHKVVTRGIAKFCARPKGDVDSVGTRNRLVNLPQSVG